MPVLRNKKTGREEFVPNELLEQAAASGEFDMPADLSVQVTTPAGRVVEGPFADLQAADQTLPLAPTGEVELAERQKQARIEEEHSGFVEGAKALGQGALEGITFGGYGAATRLLDPVAAEEMAEREKARPGLAVAGNVVGSIAPALLSGGSGAAARIASLTPAGAASKLGARIAAPGGLGARTLGFGAEGALAGFGQGVHQLAMAEDPLTVERAASVLSSNALLGGGLGGGLGVLSKAAEKGIVRARDLVREAGERYATKSAVAPELAALDAAGLRGAEKAELEAIEASRVPERAAVADEIVKYHQQKRADKPWLATKGDDEFAELAKKSLKADKRLQGFLDNPHALAENPGLARKALQQDQHALEEMVAARPRIEAKIAIETEEAAAAPGAGQVADAAPAQPVEAAPARELSVAERIDEAFTKLDDDMNFVPIADLRKELPDIPREVFDEELRALRKSRHFSADEASDATPERLEGAVKDGNQNLVFVSRRGEKLVKPTEVPATPRDALRFYQTFGYRNINRALRGDKNALKETLDTGEFGFQATAQARLAREGVFVNDLSFDRTVQLMDDAIKQARTAEPMSVYRGYDPFTINGDRPDLAALKAGDVIDANPAYTSTSAQPEWASSFSDKALFKIDMPEGTPALRVLTGKKTDLEEMEYLLPRGTSFRVKSVKHDFEVMNSMKKWQSYPEERVLIEVEPILPPGASLEAAPEAVAAGAAVEPAQAAAANGATRLASLDKAEQLLATNKSLQAKLLELERTPASQKLDDIAKARDALSKPEPSGFLRDVSRHYAMGAVAGYAPGGPIGAIAAVAAPRVARRLADWVANRLAKASAEAAGRSAKSLDAIFGTAEKVARKAPPLATRALAAASFGTSDDKAKRPRTLAGAYKARESEILSQVEAGPDGVPVMRRSARQAVADRLDGVAAVSPKLADSIETMAARRVEFLASKLPKRPDLGHVPAGPDMWQPSEQQIRTFARLVSAVEDPGAVEERVANGSVLPDEVEAYRTVYPERYMDMQRQIIERLPTLRTRLPFERRLSLSIFTGVPVDPALSPPVLRVMQSMYAAEPGTEGGTQPPQAQPQFGSVSREQPTPAQQRGGVTEI